MRGLTDGEPQCNPACSRSAIGRCCSTCWQAALARYECAWYNVRRKINMGLFGPKLEWEEPWSWAKVKGCAKEIRAEFPPMWRMFLYCAVLPVIVLLVAFSFVRHIAPEEPILERVNQLLILTPVCASLLFCGCPYLYALCPMHVIIRRSAICFARANDVSVIKAEHITALYFRDIGGRRHFVVQAKTARGKLFERTIEMPTRKVTEQDVFKFLCEAGLVHLYRADEV